MDERWSRRIDPFEDEQEVLGNHDSEKKKILRKRLEDRVGVRLD